MLNNEEFEERLEGTNQTVSEAEEIVGEFEQKSAMQFKATSNFDQIHKLFSIDVEGNVHFPNEYSGAWIEGEDLYVALTDVSDDTIKKYTSNLPFPENIKFAKMTKSLNNLESEQSEYLSFFNADKMNVSSYVDVKNNKCAFEVINLPVDNAYKMMKDTFLSVDPKYSFPMDSIIIKQGSVYTPDTDIIGGMLATRSGGNFSVGVCGVVLMPSETIYDGFITCGHKKTISETISINGNEFGKVCRLKYKDNQTGDYACVRMTSTTDTMTNKVYGSSFSYTRNITATADDVPVDTVVMKFGSKSGYATAKVYAVNATVSQTVDANTTVSIKGLTQCTLVSGASAKGDSGGPYYISNGSGNSYKFIGVHSSSSGNNISFTPYVRFKNCFYPKTSV